MFNFQALENGVYLNQGCIIKTRKREPFICVFEECSIYINKECNWAFIYIISPFIYKETIQVGHKVHLDHKRVVKKGFELEWVLT